jgi:hypothetical protein
MTFITAAITETGLTDIRMNLRRQRKHMFKAHAMTNNGRYEKVGAAKALGRRGIRRTRSRNVPQENDS